MDRAGRLIARMNMGISPEDLARAAWPLAVGKRIAARSRPVSFIGSLLVVEAEDAVWRTQLARLEGQILGKLSGIIGPGVVSRIEFRVGVPRREPQRAEQGRHRAADEADGIADPVLRRLYKTSRRKSLA